jgi:serralysin
MHIGRLLVVMVLAAAACAPLCGRELRGTVGRTVDLLGIAGSGRGRLAYAPRFSCFTRDDPPRASVYVRAHHGNAEEAKLWKPGQKLSISFLDGTAKQQALVEELAVQWSKASDLPFSFVKKEGAIRITFKTQQSKSAVGTDALSRKAEDPTMWLCILDDLVPPSDVPPILHDSYRTVTSRRAILHEFGHALGMVHEHQAPSSPIKWKKAEVKAAHKKVPPYDTMTEKELDAYLEEAFFVTFDTKTIKNGAKFDPKSIMLYEIPKEWTTGDISYDWNTELSAEDKSYIASCYVKDQ